MILVLLVEPHSIMAEENIDLAQLVSGDKVAWDHFVHSTSPVIFTLIERTLHSAGLDRADVYDVVQDTFLHLCKDEFRILKTYDPTRAKLSTWCGTIARHKAIDVLRQRRIPSVPMEEAPEISVDFADPLSDHLEIPPDLLTARQALIMRLLYEEDMDVNEVATMLSIESQTVRSARHKAVTKLRYFFKQETP